MKLSRFTEFETLAIKYGHEAQNDFMRGRCSSNLNTFTTKTRARCVPIKNRQKWAWFNAYIMLFAALFELAFATKQRYPIVDMFSDG